MAESAVDTIQGLIRDIPDFPKPGIVFKDITPLLGDAMGLAVTVDAIASPWTDMGVEAVVGIEARGFILGAPVARALGAGFVPMRKAGKLPAATTSATYGLEYGVDTIEMHLDAIRSGARTLVIDDVLATGGTAAAAATLVGNVGGHLLGFGFLIELCFLNGRQNIDQHRIEAVMAVEG
ncbi:MAG: adenine phosphoribosyltransferase [Acidimicrobiaceae bacterium]|jgi:adenine phosphoribosyltransferase|nr:adenine phosphoribosyltransferase [Acidimicrobiaceae bacterium]MBT5581773.1 adenine phosphoribosyltransferase [Acidimicrobiaceae bacterium]MBT5849211.1 adenine phosphoribosyltransferase [Acidimicrobiaceae bacterium]